MLRSTGSTWTVTVCGTPLISGLTCWLPEYMCLVTCPGNIGVIVKLGFDIWSYCLITLWKKSLFTKTLLNCLKWHSMDSSDLTDWWAIDLGIGESAHHTNGLVIGVVVLNCIKQKYFMTQEYFITVKNCLYFICSCPLCPSSIAISRYVIILITHAVWCSENKFLD